MTFIVCQHATALAAHEDNKRIEFRIVASDIFCQIIERSSKIWTSHQFYRFVFYSLILSTIIIENFIVDSILGKLYVQITSFAIGIFSVVIVYSISDIRRLLYLGKKNTGTDSMNTTCRQEKYISRMSIMRHQHFRKSIIQHTFLIFLFRNLLRESRSDFRTLVGINHVPHFSLSKRIMALLSQNIIWMNLNRQIFLGINKLDKKRKVFTKSG